MKIYRNQVNCFLEVPTDARSVASRITTSGIGSQTKALFANAVCGSENSRPRFHRWAGNVPVVGGVTRHIRKRAGIAGLSRSLPTLLEIMSREIQSLVSPFSRSLWRDYLQSSPRLSQTLAAGEVVAGGDGQMRVNACKCGEPCGAVKCEPGMVYEWPEVWPRLPD